MSDHFSDETLRGELDSRSPEELLRMIELIEERLRNMDYEQH